MAITTSNPTYVTQGPTASGQILASGPSGMAELAYIGVSTLTLDGAATTAVINFIDGTATLPFTPTAVFAKAVGGNQPAAAFIDVETSTISTNVSFTVKLSGAGTNANTLQVAFFVLK